MDRENSIKLALQHSRELFKYHAGQRIQSLNFYFVSIAVFLTGFGLVATSKLETGDRALIGAVLAFAGVYITKCFQRLDKRNEQLVLCDEKLLSHAEQTLAELSDPKDPMWTVTSSTNEHKEGIPHYSTIVPNIFCLYIILSVAGGIFSIFPWFTSIWPWLWNVLKTGWSS